VIVSFDHWLSSAERKISSNHDARSDPNDISLVVIHGISLPPGKFGTGAVESFFCNTLDCENDPSYRDIAGLRVASHLFLGRCGGVTQFVPFDRRAWHAGLSSHRGRVGCNDFSIGIELEGTDKLPYTTRQYEALHDVLVALMARYSSIDHNAIVGHNEIAPGRKSDPGPCFDWERVLCRLFGGLDT